MASFKWKKVPVFESINVSAGTERKIVKFVKVNRLSNFQLLSFSKEGVYKSDYPIQVNQMIELIANRRIA